MPQAAPLLQPAHGCRVIERRAIGCLERCRKTLGLREIPLPVPVEQWIEHPLGIHFGITDLSHLGECVLGAARPTEREILISESALGHEGRYRFTCAHELGHVLLHAKVERNFQDTQAEPPVSDGRLERQADRFAAALLMPAPLLVREIVRVCDEHHLKHRECIVELMIDSPESRWLWKKLFLPALTRRFAVSLSALLYRFRSLRRFDGRPFLVEDHVPRLLAPAGDENRLAPMEVADGFPKRPVQGVLFG